MKTIHNYNFPWWCLLLAVAIWIPVNTHGAVALTISPSSISNTFSGQITVQITGLTNGEPVLLERFLDGNTNGVVDTGEPLVQSFQLADGQVAVFGGVRDTNVPGDEDGAVNGQISTSTSFMNSPEFTRVAGNHLVRVSSPTARFSAIIRPLAVVQSAYAQRVTGRVSSAGSPVANASVALLISTGDDVEFALGTLTDGTGNYSLNTATGNFLVLAVKNGLVSDLSIAPMVTVGPSQVITQDLTLAATTRTISGKVSDAGSGAGIPGIQLFIQSDTELMTFAFTDANGDFSGSVAPGQWEIETSELSLSQVGFLGLQNRPVVDTGLGNVTGVQVQLTKESALIYGSLKDSDNNPLSGVSISARDSNQQYESNGTTDTNGNFALGVVGGSWFVGTDSQNPALAGLLVQGTNVSVSVSQAAQINLVARRFTARLIGRVVNASGTPQADIEIGALDFSSSGGGNEFVTTGQDGSFDLGVFGGTWHLQLEAEGASQRGLVGPDLVFTVTDGIDVTNINYVVQAVTTQITGSVKDSATNPLTNVFVYGNTSLNGTNYNLNARTDSTGNYQLGVMNGTWQVDVDCFDLTARGFACVSGQSVTVSGAPQIQNFVVQPFANTRPQLSQPVRQPSQFRFLLSGEAGRTYRIEAATDLSDWTILGTNTAFGGSFEFVDPAVTGFGARFYRARLVP